MYENLGRVILKTGEQVEAGVVTGPDLEWAARIEELLAHKGEIWNWQNSEMLRREVGVEARFYLLHRDGRPLAHMMTVTRQGVGHFGHVWTRPEDRRKGAANQLMDLLMDHFRQAGGRALFLGTGYDSPAYWIYAGHGFHSLEERSGSMSFLVDSGEAFEGWYFGAGSVEVQGLDWVHWPASAPLFLGDFPGVVRCAPLGLFGKSSTEGAFLPLIRDEQRRRKASEPARVQTLVLPHTGAVIGAAVWDWDRLWPHACLVDLYCHPSCWRQGAEALTALELPAAERYLAYSDPGCPDKGRVFLQAGFRQVAVHRRRVAGNLARTAWVDVLAWER